MVYKGCMRCMVNNRTEEIGAGEIFIVNSYDTHHYEYVGNAAVYILVINKEYFSHILDEETEFNNFLQPSQKTWEELTRLVVNAYGKFEEFNVLQKSGFINSFMGILYGNGLLRKKAKNGNKEFFIKVSDYISAHYGEDLRLPTLAKKIRLQ